MVPNYGFTSPTAAAFSGLATSINPQPFALGNWELDMAATGYSPAIGVLPQWESLYASTADPRAYAATIGNNRGSGRWPLHYRDENTGRVPVYSAYSNTTLTTGWGTQPTAPSGGATVWDIPHHPSNGYLAYLLVCLVLIYAGCSANEKILRSGRETPSPAMVKANAATPEMVPLARDLDEMHTAGFTFIFHRVV